MKDSISDLFTHIRNARSNYRKNIYVTKNRINTQIVDILYRQGLVNNYKLSKTCLIFNLKYEKKKALITRICRISRPGCRVYAKYQQLPKFYGKLGMILISTSRGILTDREVKYYSIGGELLGFIV